MVRAALGRLSLACGFALLSGCVLSWSRHEDDADDEAGADAGAEKRACSKACGSHQICEPEKGECQCEPDYAWNGAECAFDRCGHEPCEDSEARAAYPTR